MARSTTQQRRQVRRGGRSQKTSHRQRGLVFGAGAVILLFVATALYLALGRSGALRGVQNPTGSPSRGDVASSAAQRPIARLQTDDFHALAFNHEDPDTVFFGHHQGILKSTDGGRTWQPTAMQGADAMTLSIPAADPRTVYMAGHDVFYKSLDGGRTWQAVPADPSGRASGRSLPGLDIHAFAVHPAQPDRVYAFVVRHGLFTSGDGGLTWRPLGPGARAATALAVTRSGVIFAAVPDQGLMKSSDGGQSWSRAGRGLEGQVIRSLAYDPATDALYAGTMQGVFKTADEGTRWARLGLAADVLALAVSPANSKVLLAVDIRGQVYRSKDGGLSWGGK